MKATRNTLSTLYPVKALHLPFLLQLYSFVLLRISQDEFMGGPVISSLFHEIKKSHVNRCLVRNPLKDGVAYHIASLTIDQYFELLGHPFEIEHFFGLDQVCSIADSIFTAWACAEIPERLFSRLFDEFETYEKKYYDSILNGEEGDWVTISEREGVSLMEKISEACLFDTGYRSVRRAYAQEIADRILHDRQISAHIAEHLTNLSNKMNKHDFHAPKTKFVDRVKFPAFVKPILLARDRGKCAVCKIDLTSELLAKTHVDHIYPLAKGGCNDVVNLQLLCEGCNSKKRARVWVVESSVPQYHERLKRIAKLKQLRSSWDGIRLIRTKYK